jgi:AcrR family transcriptional regulator
VARPINANADATRRRLVDVAMGQFAQHGFHGASTRDLAAAAGVNVATVHYYFQSKQGLYDAVVDDVYRRLGERAMEIMAEVSPTELEVLLGRLYLAGRAERDGVRLLVRQVLDHGRLTARTEASHYLPEVQNLARLAAGLMGCPVEQARVAAVAVAYLVSRYVIQDEASLMTAFGVKSAKQAHARVVSTLTATARALLSSQG